MGEIRGTPCVPSHILYIVALPKSSVKSIAFKSEIGKEGLPSGSTPDLETFAQRLVGKLAHLPREQQCHGRRILLTQTHLSSLGRMNHASADCAVPGVISVDVLVAFGPKSASSGRAAVATRMFSARGVRGTSWCPPREDLDFTLYLVDSGAIHRRSSQ
jgi:hypothetical protein